LGNTVYVLLSRYIKKDIFSVIFSSICKALLLYILAFVFVKELGLPQIFLKSMGIMQFFTALIGGSFALILTKDIVLES
jgi:hypothetical protein